MTRNIFGALLPQVLIIIWAAYELYLGLTLDKNSKIFFSSLAILVFVIFAIITFVKVIKYPNDPTYLKKK